MSAKPALIVSKDGKRTYNGEMVVNAGFKNGSILRVGMLNFLTYDECEVFPGPKLNIVLGPNGTGKSTITHAICLACAGKPDTLGRSPDLKQFVKHGKEDCESFCEVDILTTDWGAPTVLCVRRYINSKTRGSTYMLNFEQTTEKVIKQKMKELNVDVNNLCCFMAQDKVGNFTRLNAQGIMEQTLQNILSEEDPERTLYDVQQDLNNIEQSKQRKSREVNAKREALQTCGMLINGMQAEVDAMRRHDQHRTMLSNYQIHRTVIETAELRTAVTQKQSLVDAAEMALQRAQDSLGPLEVEERDVRHQLDNLERTQSSSLERLKKADAIVVSNRAKIEATDIQIGISSQNLRDLDVQRASKQRQLEKAQQEERRVSHEFDRATALAQDAQKNLQSVQAELTRLERAKEEADERVHDAENIVDERRHTDHRLRERLQGMQDPRQQYRAELRKAEKQWGDEIKAMDFLVNRSAEFTAPVFGPLGCHITARDQDIAALVCSELKLDVNAFIVQNEEDERLLRRVAPTCRIFTVRQVQVEPLRVPYSQAQQASFAAFGYQGLLGSFIRCEDIVMTFLCSHHDALLKTLYAKTADRKAFTDEHSRILAPGGAGPKMFKLVMRIGNPHEIGPRTHPDFYYYTGQYSRYNESQGLTTSSKAIQPYERSQFVSVTGKSGSYNDERMQLEEELENNAKARAIAEQDVKAAIDESKRLQHQINEVQKKISLFRNGLKEPALLQKQLQKLHETIAKIQSELESDTRDQKLKLINMYSGQIKEILGFALVMAQRSDDCVKLQVDVIAENEAKINLEHMLDEVRTTLEAAREGLRDFRARKAEAMAHREEAQRQLVAATDRLQVMAKEHGGHVAFTERYHRMKGEMPEKTVPEIDARIAQLEHAISQAVDNPHVIARYEEKIQERKELEESLTKLETELSEHENNVQLNSAKWLEQVGHIVEKLNGKFQSYMQKLQYSGEVQLQKVGTIAEYEMRLLVSYTVDQPLTVLDGNRQSGGERAVATIMYLMALQELSRAPFRAVDEINQGMDERNERLVVDQIVQSCTSQAANRRSHQYFLISPKLLQGLRSMDHPDVTVLMVWNGIGLDKHKWQLGDLLVKLKAKRDRNEEDGLPSQATTDSDTEEEKTSQRRKIR